MKIIQVLNTLGYGDAIAGDVMAIKKILESEGYETEVYATYVHSKRTESNLFACEKLPMFDKDDVIILHLSIECRFNYQILEANCKVIAIYHNVTPPEFFDDYAVHMKDRCAEGLKQVASLKDKLDLVIADSEFNKQDLIEMGYDKDKIKVLPILIPYDDYRQPYDKEMYDDLKKDGYTNILFVGRVAPNKKQEDIIRIFSYYKNNINPKSRLCIVGNQGLVDYYEDLLSYSDLLNPGDIRFLGHITFSEILACYKAADLFLCMSEHEGFCVPLIEAMLFDLPIVAYESTAIPETLNDAGIIVDDKNPVFVANVIDRLLGDSNMLSEIQKGREERLEYFSFEKLKEKFICIMNEFFEKTAETEKADLENALPVIEKIKNLQIETPQVEKTNPKQIVFLSARREALLSTLVYIEKHMQFITECLVFCPDDMAVPFKNAYKGRLKLKTITDGELLSGLKLPKRHTTRNFFLRCLIMLRPELDNEFIMSDDDYRPMQDIPISFFKNNGKYNAYECADLNDWVEICKQNGSVYYDFDYLMFKNLDFCRRENYTSYCFASHQPQIINKLFFIEFLKKYPETVVDIVCEWCGYFNYMASQHKDILNVLPYVSICWLAKHIFFYEPRTEFLFENYYSENYEKGGIFEDLSEDDHSEKIRIWKENFETKNNS
ncbi:MAG: glycosyltransferase [Ruminococcus sp.]|jgi:glycosyltransferase involved in cell wall biosynthesis|nr:glycosyltransferase [Ruminococcus sp.]